MNYIGKFVTGFKYFYDEINPSNLTGAIDVVVVKEELIDGDEIKIKYRSSPFHVKFGKYDILRPKERRVDITINNIPVDVKMKLGGAGEAYFPKPNEICDCKMCLHQKSLINNKLKECESLLDSNNLYINKYDAHTNVLSDSEIYEYNNDRKKRSMSECELEELPGRKSRTVSQWEWGELPKTIDDCKLKSKPIKNKSLEDSLSYTSEGDLMSTSDILSRCYISDSHKNILDSTPTSKTMAVNQDISNNNTLDDGIVSNILHEKPPNIDDISFLFNCRISLCGGLCGSNKKPAKFDALLLTFETLISQPNILYDKDVVVEINNKYYNWMVAAPILISAYIFRKNFPKNCIKSLKMQYKKKKKIGWFAWGNKTNERATSDDENDWELNESKNMNLIHNEVVIKNISYNKCKRRVLKLESDDIAKLGLVDGSNEITFTVTSKFQGTVTIKSRIFLWDKSDKIVISDIDGTITKSDVLGHVMYFVGKEWVHRGVTTVLNQIQSNGYRIMYLSSRTIGIADITRNFIENVNTDEMRLPEGPILLSPSSLFQAIHAEMIEKKPEIFKIGCLNDIVGLFPSSINPFYAGFGNRINDAVAYKTIGINDSRIFIINSNGLIKSEHGQYQSITFNSLSTYINHIFPKMDDNCNNKLVENPKFHNYSDLIYWKSPYFIKPENIIITINDTDLYTTKSSIHNKLNPDFT